MNKSFIKSGLVVIAALVLASCSKTEEFQHNPDSALQIESVSGISPFALTTKAVITGNTLPDSDTATDIGIFVTASDGSAYDGHNKGYTNVNFANSGSGWSTATPVYLSDTEGKLYGYFPYNADATDLRAIPVQSSLNGTDYLYAEPQTVSHSNKTVSLQMNHALSRLHLTIKKGANFAADAPLSKITLNSTAIDATGTMDITTGAISASKKSGETGTVELPTDGTITAEGIVKDILLVPADNNEGKKGISISLLIDGKPAGITLSGDNGLDIRSGIQNNVTLTIEDTGIKVSGVGVSEWGEGGSQSVEVGGHKVTVKLSEDAGIADDLIVQVTSNGSSAIVKTYSDSGKPLVIRNDDTTLLAPVEEGNKSTFTFSDVTKDITATLAYAKTRTVTFNLKVDKAPNVSGYVYGKVEPVTMVEGRILTLTAVPGEGYAFDYFEMKGVKYDNQAEVVIPDDAETIDAYFRFSDWLGGVFTVADDGRGNIRKVRFSRGNLWCDGTDTGYSAATPKIKSWGFESKQYESTPSSYGDRTISHISHFMWCKSAKLSVEEKYSETTGLAANDNLFTNASPTEPSSNFDINGQQGFWRALSGGDSGEWKYLIERKDSEGNALYKLGVTVCGRSNCLVLLPDDWEWDANTVGTGWQTEYSESTTVKWSTMEASGAVCLPAAGIRLGRDGDTSVSTVGSFGYYWSASPSGSSYALYLSFRSDTVDPNNYCARYRAQSVRLVTDVK